METAYKNKVASAIELLDGEIQHEKITQVFKFDDILMRAIEKYQKGKKEV